MEVKLTKLTDNTIQEEIIPTSVKNEITPEILSRQRADLLALKAIRIAQVDAEIAAIDAKIKFCTDNGVKTTEELHNTEVLDG